MCQRSGTPGKSIERTFSPEEVGMILGTGMSVSTARALSHAASARRSVSVRQPGEANRSIKRSPEAVSTR